MIRRYFIVVLLLLFLFPYAHSHAAGGTPTILSYQGRLTDASGNLLGGSGTNYYFKFSIWTASSGGSKLWPASDPTQVTVKVTQGVFNVNIGDTANSYPDALTYNFNTNNDVYLRVDVSSTDGGTFEALAPRQRISSAAFARLSGAVSGTGQSSFGTTAPNSSAIVTIASSSTSFIPLLIRSALGNVANLFRIEDQSTSTRIFSIDSSGDVFASSSFTVGQSSPFFVVASSGNVGVGTGGSLTRTFNVFKAVSTPQFRLGQSDSVYGEFYTDSAGDVRLSATGGNIRQNDENVWVCAGGGCGAAAPSDKGNVIIETSVIFNNDFRFKQLVSGASKSVTMYDSGNNVILDFDEEQQ